MLKAKHQYRVTYAKGLGEPKIFEADSSIEARKMALAEYRRRCGMVDFKPLDAVVQKDVEDLGPIC